MATAEETLGADDDLTEYLLLQVAKSVKYNTLELLAKDLKITETMLQDIVATFQNKVEVQKFKVSNLKNKGAWNESKINVIRNKLEIATILRVLHWVCFFLAKFSSRSEVRS